MVLLEFAVKALCEGSAFVPCTQKDINEILYEQHERTVGKDNCVNFENIILQIPQQLYRANFIKVKIKVHRYHDRSIAIFHGPRLLARYCAKGNLIKNYQGAAA